MNDNIVKLMRSPQLKGLSHLVVDACLYHREYPVSSVRRVFANPDETLSFLHGDMSDDDYVDVFHIRGSRAQHDDELRGIIWSLLLYVFSFCEIYEYDMHEVDVVLDKHLGWEYLACIWRDICREEASGGAKVIHDFVVRN